MGKLKSIIVVLVIVASAVLTLGLGIVLSLTYSNVICRGVTVAGVSVAGLTKDQAFARISEASANRLAQVISLYAGNRRWTGQIKDLGVRADVRRAVEDAFRVGREGTVSDRIWDCLIASETNVRVKYLVDRKQFDSALDKIAGIVEIPRRDARLIRMNGKFTIQPEQVGIRLDKETSALVFERTVEAGDLSLNIKLVPDMPRVTSADLYQVDTLLGSFATRFPAWRKDRTHNIRVAAAKVNGTVLKPGEVFSYNMIVGPRLKSLGYREAPIFIKGKLVPGTGGGVCQLSSTIYNAALLANMKIIERSNHSSTVPYVEAGRDATVAYGFLDLQFENTSTAPVYVAAWIIGSDLHVDIYGAKRDKADVAIVIANKGKLDATVYRVVKKKGQVVSRELISRDRYRPAEPIVDPSQHDPIRLHRRPPLRPGRQAQAASHSG